MADEFDDADLPDPSLKNILEQESLQWVFVGGKGTAVGVCFVFIVVVAGVVPFLPFIVIFLSCLLLITITNEQINKQSQVVSERPRPVVAWPPSWPNTAKKS